MHGECAVFLIRGKTVLLGHCAGDRFIGPPVDRIGPLEDAQDAAVRIVRTLTGFDFQPGHWPAGIVVMVLPNKSYRTLHVFTTADFIVGQQSHRLKDFTGDWVEQSEIRYNQLAPGSELWVPFALKGCAFRIQLELGEDSQITDYRMLA